jgi:hypothetical protein
LLILLSQKVAVRSAVESVLDQDSLRVRLKTLLRIAEFSQHEADGRKF